MTSSHVALLIALFCSTDAACQSREFEREFFNQPRADRLERARKLPLEQQYKVFRYGNEVIHPPMIELADPIAEQGSAAVPFLLDQLAVDRTDLAVRDVALVFSRMAQMKTYDVMSDARVMATLNERVDKMKDRDWRDVASKTLKSIRDR